MYFVASPIIKSCIVPPKEYPGTLKDLPIMRVAFSLTSHKKSALKQTKGKNKPTRENEAIQLNAPFRPLSIFKFLSPLSHFLSLSPHQSKDLQLCEVSCLAQQAREPNNVHRDETSPLTKLTLRCAFLLQKNRHTVDKVS